MKNINLKTEKIRREKISRTLREKHRNGELKQWNLGMKMSREYRKKLSDYWKTHNKKGRIKKGHIPWNKGLKGFMGKEKNHRWKGGISSMNVKIRGSIEMREWRGQVFKRDNYVCQVCNKVGGKLNAHHLKKFSDYPELRFDVNNGITLCEFCHRTYTNYKASINPANSVNSRTDNAELGLMPSVETLHGTSIIIGEDKVRYS